MKKKIMASLLVGSAVVGASLAPLSAQAVTTGNTPVQVEFGGGTLPNGDRDTNTVDPDPTKPNSNFDLLYIPREFDFGKLSISDDLTKPIPNKNDVGALDGHTEKIAVGDLRGTKEGWHLTAESNGMNLETESLQGNITATNGLYVLTYDENTNSYTSQGATVGMETRPEVVNRYWSLPLGGGAVLVGNATSGKGQGLWQFSMFSTALNITTPAYDIKAGAYTGNITWNLVAGPSI
ncbi:WxL domain-containing protein [Enterococcus faecalis]|uniref:WxL domain-containing protein n=1 Tax=Enterococcus faecalis RP2S-4 TaxID=1244145 RepID=A0ABC9TJB9_ENTFL|nr:WxL domain-containing protein [Enterococcus faecalis]EGO2591721.1 WxL domain-containing protein [Enterococcus faecalis]EGO2725545.1 WxL domain-containing protein [Enterococcus faecalis]EGO2796339.1 WxL domain-containing protein [Enterococcus faecalis]EGO5136195.1 WxL domain-containing protein [Enterococcus faecalis]EGO5159209.1 WxL domain-containing protein [Enterococcus faecalis]